MRPSILPAGRAWILVQGPVVAGDSTLRLVTGVNDAAAVPTTLVSALSASGEVLWQARLEEDYQQTWEQALTVAGDGTTVVRTFRALTAVGPDGAVLDVATGEERWRVDGPPAVAGRAFHLGALALAPSGCLLGANHGGMLFAACDPQDGASWAGGDCPSSAGAAPSAALRVSRAGRAARARCGRRAAGTGTSRPAGCPSAARPAARPPRG